MTQPERQPDRDLIADLVQRDQAALGELYDRYAPLVYALALRVLGQPRDAQEAVGDVFHQVWQQARRYDGRGSVHAWIFTIARSRAVDRLRARQRQEAREQPLDPGEAQPLAAADAPGPEQLALQSDRRRQVLQALDTLPHAQRQAIELAYFGGLTHVEIAQQLREPLGTIKTRIHLGMKALRTRLAPAMQERVL